MANALSKAQVLKTQKDPPIKHESIKPLTHESIRRPFQYFQLWRRGYKGKDWIVMTSHQRFAQQPGTAVTWGKQELL